MIYSAYIGNKFKFIFLSVIDKFIKSKFSIYKYYDSTTIFKREKF